MERLVVYDYVQLVGHTMVVPLGTAWSSMVVPLVRYTMASWFYRWPLSIHMDDIASLPIQYPQHILKSSALCVHQGLMNNRAAESTKPN